MPECYICADDTPCDGPRPSACSCIDRYVHDACLQKMLALRADRRCPVCLCDLSNVQLVERRRLQLTRQGGVLLVLAFMSVVLVSCAASTLTHAARTDDDEAHTVLLASGFAMCSVSGVGVASMGWLVRRHRPHDLSSLFLRRVQDVQIVR